MPPVTSDFTPSTPQTQLTFAQCLESPGTYAQGPGGAPEFYVIGGVAFDMESDEQTGAADFPEAQTFSRLAGVTTVVIAS